jgi:hypothetical protein
MQTGISDLLNFVAFIVSSTYLNLTLCVAYYSSCTCCAANLFRKSANQCPHVATISGLRGSEETPLVSVGTPRGEDIAQAWDETQNNSSASAELFLVFSETLQYILGGAKSQ